MNDVPGYELCCEFAGPNEMPRHLSIDDTNVQSISTPRADEYRSCCTPPNRARKNTGVIMDVEGHAAFVGRASQGIGTALREDYRPRDYHELANTPSVEGPDEKNTAKMSGDIGKRTVAERIICKTLPHFGRSDALVNKAGSSSAKALIQQTEQDIVTTVSANREEAGPPFSGFKCIARSSLGLSHQRRALLSCLFGSGLTEDRSGPAVLRPLWANDAMQRAYDMVRLTAALDAASPAGGAPQATFAVESRVAAELALTYRQLSAHDAQDQVPCSGSLRTVLRNVVELFGMPFGGPELRTDIQSMTMPAFQCRALVLAASGLVMSALTETFAPVRRIDVELTPLGFGVMRLRTAVISATGTDAGCSHNLQDLVSLLDEGCLHAFAAGGGYEVEVYFRPNRYRPAVPPRCYRATS
jgi:hypothetical protein